LRIEFLLRNDWAKTRSTSQMTTMSYHVCQAQAHQNGDAEMIVQGRSHDSACQGAVFLDGAE